MYHPYLKRHYSFACPGGLKASDKYIFCYQDNIRKKRDVGGKLEIVEKYVQSKTTKQLMTELATQTYY